MLLTIQTIKKHTVTQTIRRVENGVPIAEKVTRDVVGPVLSGATLAESGMTFMTPDDKPLTADAVNDRFKAGGVLIAPAEGDEVDGVYLKLLAADAVVVRYKNEGVEEKKTIYVNPIIRFEKRVIAMPTLVAVKADDKGVIRVPAMGLQEVIVQVPVTKIENDKPVVELKDQKVKTRGLVPTPVDEVKPEVTTADGKPVAADAMKKQLAAGVTVVVSGDGKPLDDQFRKLFKPDTLVLVSEKMATPPRSGLPGARPVAAPPVK